MSRLTLIVLVLFIGGLANQARQQQVRGQIVNRDGVPQKCQVDFYTGNDLQYRVVADNKGYFFLNDPRYGSYRVVVLQGNRQDAFKASIDQYGLHPPTFVVQW